MGVYKNHFIKSGHNEGGKCKEAIVTRTPEEGEASYQSDVFRYSSEHREVIRLHEVPLLHFNYDDIISAFINLSAFV